MRPLTYPMHAIVNTRHLSSSEGCYSVVEWLLAECGVEVNPVDRFKRTPLEVRWLW